MIDRAFLLSDPKYHQKNFEYIISTLLKNDYSIDLIFDTINAHLKILIHKGMIQQKESSEEIKRICTLYSKNFRRIQKN